MENWLLLSPLFIPLAGVPVTLARKAMLWLSEDQLGATAWRMLR